MKHSSTGPIVARLPTRRVQVSQPARATLHAGNAALITYLSHCGFYLLLSGFAADYRSLLAVPDFQEFKGIKQWVISSCHCAVRRATLRDK